MTARPLAAARFALVLTAAVAASACGPSAPARVRFDPVTAESGLRFRHDLPGGALDSLPKSAMGGFAIIDYDQDGRPDVFCVNGGWHEKYALAPPPEKPSSSRLFRNLGGMKFEDVTDATGTKLDGFGMGAVVGDIDGDGRPDLFVSCYGRSVLLRNNGHGFEDMTDAAGIDVAFATGATFVDYDRDGDLDLFVGQYVDPARLTSGGTMTHGAVEGSFPSPGAYEPMPAKLYRNKGDGTFDDVSSAAGVARPGKAMGVIAADFDGDGLADIYVANDSMPNFLWRNKGDGTFLETAAAWGLALGREGEDRASMGVTLVDLDGDGREELLSPDTRGGVCYQPRETWFTDRAADWRLVAASTQLVGWAAAAIDADNDGHMDLYMVHGDLRSLTPQPSFLLRAVPVEGDLRLDRMDEGLGTPELEATGRSGVAVDLDDDGREDLVVSVLEGRLRAWHNQTPDGGKWLRVKLVGSGKNPLAIGAVVRGTITSGGTRRTLVRRVASSTGYLSAPDLRMHFGLGTSSSLEDVVVTWPDGTSEKVPALDGGREHVIRRK